MRLRLFKFYCFGFLLLGCFFGLGHEPFNTPIIAFFSLPLTGYFWVNYTKSKYQSFFLGYFLGLGYFGLTFPWIINPFLIEFDNNFWVAIFGYTIFVGFLALFWGLAFYLSFRATQKIDSNKEKVLIFSVFVVFMELTRSYIFSGFPWGIVAYAWIDSPAIVFVSWLGPYWFSALILILGFTLFYPTFITFSVGAIILLSFLYGIFGNNYELEQSPRDNVFTIRIVQPNIEQKEKWKKENENKNLNILLNLSEKEPHPDLVVWPETSVTWLPEENINKLNNIVKRIKAPLILGGLRFNREKNEIFNSSFLIDKDGKIVSIYDKSFLVPFGEYFPLSRFLGYIKLFGTPKLLRNGFTSGKGLKVTGKISIPPYVTLICYESLFSNEIIDKINDAQWLLNLTNDAWFGKSGGPNQHLAISRMRALENNLPLVRVANTGISAKINKFGRVTRFMGVDERGFIDVKINRKEILKTSFYVKLGKNISSYLLLLTLISILMNYFVLNKIYRVEK